MSCNETQMKYRQIMSSPVDEAINLINAMDDINIADENGFKLLDYLLDPKRDSYEQVLRVLIDKGASICRAGSNKNWLRDSIKHMTPDELQLLLDAGADPNHASYTMTPLNYVISNATGNQQTQMVSRLLAAGANPNIKGDENDRYEKKYSTALICALTQKKINKEVIAALLNAGADAAISDCDGYTCIYYAIKANNIESISLLVRAGGNVNFLGPKAAHPLSYMGGGPKLLQNLEKLIQLGLNIFAIDVEGNSAINYVLSNSKAVDLLIKHGARPDGKVLRVACRRGLIKSIQVLILAGADIQEKDSEGRSLIFEAAHEPKVIKTLIRHGCPFDEADQFGNTPLMEAIDNGYFESAQILIKRGANVLRLNEKGDGPLHLACRGGKYGQLCNVPEASQIITLLIKAGLPLNVQNSEGMTPLMYSVQGAGLNEILQHGPDLDLQNLQGKTALMLAAERCERYDELQHEAGKKCNACMVKDCGNNVALLMAAGANLALVDLAGRSARDYASLRAKTLLDGANEISASDISKPIKQLIEQHKKLQSPKEFVEFLDNLAVSLPALSEKMDIRNATDASWTIERLYKHIERAQWGVEFKPKQVSTAQLDRCGEIYCGPLFVSSAYPWPRNNNGYLLPLLQINLSNVGQIVGGDFGCGLLQLWGEPESFKGCQIRVVPEEDVSPNLLDASIPIPVVEIEEKSVKIFPLSWLPRFGGMSWVINGYKKKHFSFHSAEIESLAEHIDEESEDEFRKSIWSKAGWIEQNFHPKSNSIGGSFYPIQYTPDEKPPVLINFSAEPYGWGADGNAQIFYEKQADGTFNYSFDWSCG